MRSALLAAMDPSTKEFMGQPDFLQKLEMIQKNPSMMQMHMQAR